MSADWVDPYADVPPPDCEPDSDAEPDAPVIPIGRGQRGRRAERDQPTAAECSEFTDSATSERLVAEALKGRWLYTKGLGWLRWTGVVWAPDPDEALVEVTREWVNGEVARVAADGVLGRTRGAAGLQSASRIKRLAELARGQLLADAARFDQDADVLVCANGVVDLQTGQLSPHDPARLVTKRTPVAYRPDATHSDWDAALAALPADCRDWAQTRFGQAATGHQPDDDKMLVLQGAGENGKSTLLVGILRALGSYAQLVPDQLLLGSADAHPTDLMTLRGARLALIEETPEGRRLNVSRLKKILGTPEISGRGMRENFTTFKATHALVLSTNYLLAVDETDHGTWRRLARLVCPFKFVGAGKPLVGDRERHGDPQLKPRMESGKAQAEAVLAWLVVGAMRWYRVDRAMPAPPARVERDTREWRAQSDSVLAYAMERLEADSNSRIWTADLLADFNNHLAERGQRVWSDRTFAERFGSHIWTSDHRVEKVRGRHPDTAISRSRNEGLGPIPAVHPAWVGIRFTAS